MATAPETVEFILGSFDDARFSTRSMFGEYALYANGKTVAFICDDILYVKILPASAELEAVCEKGPAYPGSKPYYIVEEPMISQMPELPSILLSIAESIPAKKKSSGAGAKKKRA